jgi:hypothetical protein
MHDRPKLADLCFVITQGFAENPRNAMVWLLATRTWLHNRSA